MIKVVEFMLDIVRDFNDAANLLFRKKTNKTLKEENLKFKQATPLYHIYLCTLYIDWRVVNLSNL